MSSYVYQREFFHPPETPTPLTREEGLAGADPRGRSPYQFSEDIILAVNVAWAANRPLLVSGVPGTGKSMLASAIAAEVCQQRRALTHVVTSRTEARDLKWRFDAVRRLRDATVGKLAVGPMDYIDKGVLWEAFAASEAGEQVVVLIDEIDKADPDVPNGLLDVLGAGMFYVDEVRADDGAPLPVCAGKEHPPFIVVTTNDERELPQAFLRRCIALTLPPPSNARLVKIAAAWGLADGEREDTATRLANLIAGPGGESGLRSGRPPNAAEYLDALRTCLTLGVELEGKTWEAVARLTLDKRTSGADDGR